MLTEHYADWLKEHQKLQDTIESFRKDICDLAMGMLNTFPPFCVIQWYWYGKMSSTERDLYCKEQGAKKSILS